MDSISDFDLTVPRSCWPCHKKKVRCDRAQPCATCTKSGSRCSYPDLDQRKKSRRVPVNALLSRLAQLEKKVSTLSDQPKQEDKRSETRDKASPTTSPGSISTNKHQYINTVGSGVILNHGGESRYFGDSFIASLARDAKELSPATENAVLSSDKLASSANEALVYDSPPLTDLGQPLHLDPRSGWRALRLWQLYLSNVEPMLKILHVPSTQPRIYAAMQTPHLAEETLSMLLNAVCFAAMITLDNEESQRIFSADRSYLLQTYREQTEKYISKLNLMLAPNLEYLQALTIYITTLRVIDNTRSVWILTGMAIRIAQSLGIHMDGAAFNLPPFDSELRRRVWWHIFLLEIRNAEDHGLLVSDFTASKYPPQYPSNLNDEDIWPGMSESPVASKQATSSTLTVLRILLADQIIHLGLYPLQASNQDELLESINESRRKVKSAYDKIRKDWLDGEEQKMTNYYTAAQALLDFSTRKAEFLILFRAYQSSLLNETEKELTRASAVTAALKLIEGLNMIEVDVALKRFHWYSKSNPQWFTVGFLLQQLYRGLITDQETRHRTQTAIEETFEWDLEGSQGSIGQRRGAIWVALRLLKDKAFAKYSSNDAFGHSGGASSASEFATPDSTDMDALDSMFDFNTFDFSQLAPVDMSMFDSQLNIDMAEFAQM